MAKLFEAIVRSKIEKEITDRCFSENQYGFRKARSTIGAIGKVTEKARKTREKWCALLTLDVRNAFNSASWEMLMGKLRELVPQWVLRTIWR